MQTNRRRMLLQGGAAGLFLALLGKSGLGASTAQAAAKPKFEVTHTDEEWRQMLSPLAYAVLRQQGTERPFTSPLNDEHGKGIFACAGCDQELFLSQTKFDSRTGWPSFYQAMKGAVIENTDNTLGMSRTEVECKRCGGHLGHVFDDGPRPTGLRYCMNGVAMKFKPAAA